MRTRSIPGSRSNAWISGLGVGIALLTCVGCGGDHDSGSAADEQAPAARTPRPTRTPIRAGFTATAGDALPGTPTPTKTGQFRPVTATPPLTPVTGTETATPTPFVPPTWTPPADPHGVLRIGRVRGEPGTIASVDVTLIDVDEGFDIVATQNDLSVDGDQIALVENTDGDPGCVVNPELGREATTFRFQPPDCGITGSCTGVRALVLSFFNLDAIPSGSVLYTCNVAILANAEPGAVYALPCALALASSPEGDPIDLECEDGAIEVIEGSHVPTPIPDPLAEGTCYESSTCDQFPRPASRGNCCEFCRRTLLPCTWCPADMIDPSSGACTQCVGPCEGLPTPTPDLAARQ